MARRLHYRPLSLRLQRQQPSLSFITIGEAFRQETIPLNAIAAAAFFSLLIHPELLYSVSFQMSYAAYTGIILIYPLMRIKKMHKYLRPLYSLLCISFSAQAMTLPIMAYYFHTISLNSIFINIISVPIASFLLYGGIMLLATGIHQFLLVIHHHWSYTPVHFQPTTIFQNRDKSAKFSYISKFHIIISCKLIVYIVMCFYQETN
ncbi:MAG: ComEC/Rec2 family competence protein [Alistipes putredinis]